MEAQESKSFDITAFRPNIEAAVIAAEVSTFAVVTTIASRVNDISDIPDAPKGTAHEIAEQSAAELQAMYATDAALRELALKFGTKKDSNLCARVARILKEKALFGTGEGALWVDEAALYKALNWTSGAVYMASWQYVAKLEKQADDDKKVVIPTAASANHRKNNATIAQRVFCYAGQAGVTAWKQAEKKLSLADQATLLRGCEVGLTLQAGDASYALYSIGYGHPSVITDNTTTMLEYRAAQDAIDRETARQAELSAETEEQKETRLQAEKVAAAKAEADRIAEEQKVAQAKSRADELARQQAEAEEGKKLQEKIDAVVAKGKIESQEDISLIRQSLTAKVIATARAYRAYQDANRAMCDTVALLPRKIFEDNMSGLKTRVVEETKDTGLDLWAKLDTANKKANSPTAMPR